eukprot:GHVL01030711.1.p1 GENE.GHVL01030711.1~~GHVL01030711.1.p1  ORF type:complete len:890 (-),score=192.87 GHVL01030711.1:2871-5540(-)
MSDVPEDLTKFLTFVPKLPTLYECCKIDPKTKSWVPDEKILKSMTKEFVKSLLPCRFIIQKAPSGFSRCRKCGMTVAKNSVRIGYPTKDPRGDYGALTCWFHPSCCTKTCIIEDYESIFGWNDLTEEEKECFKNCKYEDEVPDEPKNLTEMVKRHLTERHKPPRDLIVPLLPFQEEGLAWMCNQEDSNVKGGILADEMGMGKTIQTISLILCMKERNAEGPTLIITPLAAALQWKSEIERFTVANALSVLVYHGSNRQVLSEEFDKYDIVLTTYPTVESDYRQIANCYKLECEYCQRSFLPEKLKVHQKYFCGPTAQRTLKQRKTTQKHAAKKAMKTLNIGGETTPTLSNVYKEIMAKANKPVDKLPWLTPKSQRDTLGQKRRRATIGAEISTKTSESPEGLLDIDDDEISVKNEEDENLKRMKVADLRELYNKMVPDNVSPNKLTKAKLIALMESQKLMKQEEEKEDVKPTIVIKLEEEKDGKPTRKARKKEEENPTSRKARTVGSVTPQGSKKKIKQSKKSGKMAGKKGKIKKKNSDDSGSNWSESDVSDSEASDSEASESDVSSDISPVVKSKKLPRKARSVISSPTSVSSRKKCRSLPSLSPKKSEYEYHGESDGLSQEEEEFDLSESPLHKQKWHRIILDEAHRIKARISSTAKAVYALTSIKSKWCLTGTPLQNRVAELYALVRFIRFRPYAYYYCSKKGCTCESLSHVFIDNKFCAKCDHTKMCHYSLFNRKIVNPIIKFGYVGEGKAAMNNLRDEILNHILLRRTKTERAADVKLPPLKITIRTEKLSKEEWDFYESLYMQSQIKFNTFVEEGVILHNYAHIFDLLSRLRQAVDHPYLIVHGAMGTNGALADIPCSSRGFESTCGLCQDDIPLKVNMFFNE